MSCSTKSNNLTVKVDVKGLKKGIIYLKKIKDTSLVTVDSVVVNGNSNFELHGHVESPEMFFLYLDKNSSEKDRISFFADKGITEINTSLKNFAFDAKIKGSKQQKVFEEYQTFISKSNNRNLDLLKEAFDAKKNNDTIKLKAIEKEQSGALRRKYLYIVNFAINNNDSEVSPYLALSEIYDARIELLDTINQSLTPEVKNSKYGKELERFINEIKQESK